MVKIIASSVRKGNVLEVEGKLYVVLTAQNFHPGKGTRLRRSTCAHRRRGEGSERWKTTEQVERAFVEDAAHSFLYADDEGFHFMNRNPMISWSWTRKSSAMPPPISKRA